MFLGSLGTCIEASTSINEAGQTVYTTFNSCQYWQLRNEGIDDISARQAATSWTYGPSQAGEAPGYVQGPAPVAYSPPSPPPAPVYSPTPATLAPAGGGVSMPAPPADPLTYGEPIYTIMPVIEPRPMTPPPGEAYNYTPVETPVTGGQSPQVAPAQAAGFPWLALAAVAAAAMLF